MKSTWLLNSFCCKHHSMHCTQTTNAGLKDCIDNMSVFTKRCKQITWPVVRERTTKSMLNAFQLPARAQLLWDWQIRNYFRESKARRLTRDMFCWEDKGCARGRLERQRCCLTNGNYLFFLTFVPLIAVNFEIHYSCMSRPTSKRNTPYLLRFSK